MSLAKPLVTSSEDTYQSVCLEYADTPERLIEICAKALEAKGSSASQRLELMDSLAWAHENIGDRDTARSLFAEMYDTSPQSSLALNGLGWMDFMADDYVQSAGWFEKAMEVNPEAQALAGLGSSLYRAGQLPLDEAVGYLDAAIAISPSYMWALREKAWLFMREDQYEPALEVFEAVLDIEPDDDNANYGVAYILSEQGEWEQALEHVNRALQADPNYGSALSRRSLILLYLDRPRQALQDAEAVIELWPDDSDGYVRKARAQAALGLRGDALATLYAVEEVIGYESYLNYWLASLLFDDDQNAAALEVLTPVFEQGDADYYDHALRMQILLTDDEFEAARAALDETLKAHPDEEWLIYYDALTLIGEKRFAEAETRFDEAAQAGLPDEELSFFLKQLVGAAQYVQAVQMRMRYSDKVVEKDP